MSSGGGAMGGADVVLEGRGLAVRQGGVLAFAGLDLDVARGTLHLVRGPNGSGKSSLLGALLGLVPHEGTLVRRLPEAARVAFVPQNFPVDPTWPLTVADFLALSRQRRAVAFGVRRDVRRAIDGLLEREGLAGFGSRLLATLSGGELRRVLLANAFDPAPALVLLDEPAAGLDRASAERLAARLRELVAAGATALVVAHDAEQAIVGDAVTELRPRGEAERGAA